MRPGPGGPRLMKVTFKLYATLQNLLPSDAVNNAVVVDVAENASLNEVIKLFKVPPKSAHLVLVNGVYFAHGERDTPGALVEGDVLAVWPPVAGG